MVKKVVQEAKVEYIQIVDQDGNADETLLPDLSDDEFKKMYEVMIFVRMFDQKVFNMQRQGRVGTYIQVAGQEGTQVGASLAMDDGDMLFPSFRESGMLIARKHPISRVIQYWNGDERGLANDEGPRNFPISIPVGTHIPHAAGAAFGFKAQGKRQAAVAIFGDGASSKGDFHEGINFAGVTQSPAVFICQNNQFAISVPREKQTRAETIAIRAAGYGVHGVQVDGNDVVAVYTVMKEALERAKNGEGPTLIEAMTYRMGDHSTSDDAKKYRDNTGTEEWAPKDPVLRYEKFLEKKGLWTPDYKEKLEAHVKEIIEKEVETFESYEDPDPKDMFEATYAEMPVKLQKQLEELKQ